MSYWFVFKKTLESRLLYVNEIFLENLSIIFQGLFSIFLGIYLNNVNPVFSSMNDLMIYYFFGTAIINSFQRGNVPREIENEVISGNINTHLVKPYDFIVYMILRFFSQKFYKAVINAIFFLIIFNLISPFNIPLIVIIRALFIIPLTLAFMFLNVSLFSYLSIYLENSGRLSQVYLMLSFFLGGGLVSADYYPVIVKYLPQFFFFGAPLNYILTGSFPNLGLFIFYFLFFIIINILIKRFVYRRLETNG